MPRTMQFLVVDPPGAGAAAPSGSLWDQVEGRVADFEEAFERVAAHLRDAELPRRAWNGEGPDGRLPFGYLDPTHAAVLARALRGVSVDEVRGLDLEVGVRIFHALQDSARRAARVGRGLAFVVAG